ncbi:collagen alpha-1(I) chain-like [Pseudopipra pipra]|uniref:collagen alpha-1(I) chain-like n=1 Tax=Pseudopipra pipra TaxID=415032 RepID=UPI003139DCF2
METEMSKSKWSIANELRLEERPCDVISSSRKAESEELADESDIESHQGCPNVGMSRLLLEGLARLSQRAEMGSEAQPAALIARRPPLLRSVAQDPPPLGPTIISVPKFRARAPLSARMFLTLFPGSRRSLVPKRRHSSADRGCSQSAGHSSPCDPSALPAGSLEPGSHSCGLLEREGIAAGSQPTDVPGEEAALVTPPCTGSGGRPEGNPAMAPPGPPHTAGLWLPTPEGNPTMAPPGPPRTAGLRLPTPEGNPAMAPPGPPRTAGLRLPTPEGNPTMAPPGPPRTAGLRLSTPEGNPAMAPPGPPRTAAASGEGETERKDSNKEAAGRARH